MQLMPILSVALQEGMLYACIGLGVWVSFRVLAFPDLNRGERPADATWQEIVALATTLRGDIGGSLTVELRGTELWTEALGHPVRLGYPIDLADKARTLRALLAESLPNGATIDVSSPQRPAVSP